MSIFVEPVKRRKISDQVFDQIKELIYRGQLKPGEQLLPERELAEVMAVSRSTVRDAIQQLIAKNLVYQIQGKGTFVRTHEDKMKNPLAAAIQAQEASLENLFEIRMGLECTAAYLAARKADESDISALIDSYNRLTEEHLANRLGSHADTSFHMAIAYASKNPLHILIMRNIYDYLFHGIRENLESLYKDPENIRATMKQHQDILNAIVNREPDLAYKKMKEHINFVATIAENKFRQPLPVRFQNLKRMPRPQ